MSAPTDWTAEQKALVEGLRSAGATNADNAARIEKGLALSEAALKPLIDAGVVREASRDRYYIHEASVTLNRKANLQADLELAPGMFEARQPFDWSRLIKTVIFWLVMILIPIILLQVMGSRN